MERRRAQRVALRSAPLRLGVAARVAREERDADVVVGRRRGCRGRVGDSDAVHPDVRVGVLALPILALSLPRTKRVGTIIVALAVALVGVTSLATIRNWVVARQFVPVSSSGSINLRIGNEPPTPVVVPAERKAVYERLGFDANVQVVVEYARQSPRAFLDGLRRKAAYALGSFSTLAPNGGRSVFYMSVSALALVGVLLLIARPSWLRRAGLASFLPLSLAIAHVVVLVVVFPTTYGDRLLLPFYALLAPYVGLAVFAAHSAVWRLAGPRSALVLWAALVGLCVWRLLGGAPELPESVVAIAMLAWGLCVFGVPRLPAPAAVVYGGLAVGLFAWAAVNGTANLQAMVRMDLLLLMMVLCSSVLVAGGVGLRVSGTPVLVWAGVGITVVTLAVLHRWGATAPAMILAGLVLGTVQSVSVTAGHDGGLSHGAV